MKKKLLVWIIVAVAVLMIPIFVLTGKNVISNVDLFDANSEIEQEKTVQKNEGENKDKTLELKSSDEGESETVADRLKEKLESQQEEDPLSEEGIAKQNDLLELISSVQKKVEEDKSLTSAYAGEYIDEDGDLVICVTDENVANKIKDQVEEELANTGSELIDENNVEYNVVEYSKNTLDNTKKALDEKNSTLDRSALTSEQSELLSRLVSYGVEYIANCVDVGIQEYTEKDKKIFESIFGSYPCLKYYKQAPASTASTYKPGKGIYVYVGDRYWSRISIGYKAFKDVDGNGVPNDGDVYGFTTCAHGVYERKTNYIYNSLIANEDSIIGIVYENGFELDSSSNKMDYSFVKLAPNATMSEYTEYENRIIDSLDTVNVGVEVWKEGGAEPNTEFSTVRQVNTTAFYKSYPGISFIDVANTTSGLSKRGDSGGIVYKSGTNDNYQAVGIVSGGTADESLPKEKRTCNFVMADKVRDKHEIYVHSGSEVNAVNTVTNGSIGDISWELRSGTLYISGSGEMPDFYCAPWSHLNKDIKAVVVYDGITSIGDYAFYNCYNLTKATLGKDVTSIGYNAFAWCTNLETVTTNSDMYNMEYNAFYKCDSLNNSQTPIWVSSTGYNASGIPSLEWKHVVGSVKYEILRSNERDGIYSVLDTTTENWYMDSDTEPGNNYFYIIKAVFSNENYTASDNKCIECRCAMTTIWYDLDAATGKPKIEWDAVSGATQYFVGYKDEPSDNAPYEFYTYVTGTSYIFNNVPAGSTYHYIVRAVDKQEYNSFAKYYEITCKYPRPTGLSVFLDTSTGKPKLTWDVVEGAPYYSVEVSKDNGKTYYSAAQVEECEYVYSEAESGNNIYYFRVQAGNSAYSSPVSIDYYKPSKFTITVDTSSGKPKLVWDKDSEISKYYIYCSDNVDGVYTNVLDEVLTSEITNSKITYVDTTAEAGKKYYYRIYADGATYGGYTEILEITCKLPQPIATIKHNESNGKPEISWDEIEGAYGYRVYRSTSISQTGNLLHTMGDTTCIDYTAEPNKTYYYSVQAFILKINSASSMFSQKVSCICEPTVSMTFTLKNSSAGVPCLKWELITGTSQYRVLRAEEENGEYVQIDRVSSSISTYTDKLAVPECEYYYRVESLRRINSDEVILARSAVENCICKCAQPKLKIETVIDSSNAKYAKLKFGVARGASYYLIYRSTDNKGYEKIAFINNRYALSYVDKTVQPGVKYYYKVRAVPKSGKFKASSYSNIATFFCTP